MEEEAESFVCILEEEFEKLQRAQNFLFDIQSASRERINLIRLQVEKELQYKIDKIERNYVQYQKFIGDLNGEIKLLELENQRRLHNQDKKFELMRAEYIEGIKGSIEHYTSLIETQNKKFNKIIKEETSFFKESLDNIKENLNYIVDTEKSKKEKVKLFLTDLGKIFEDTEKNNLDKHNLSKKIEELRRKFVDAMSDFQAGFFESAWNTAKSVYWEITDIRNNIKETEKKYFVLESAIYEVVSELLENIEGNKHLKITFLNKKIDLNYWLNGRLNNIRKDLLDIIKNVKESKYNIYDLNDVLRKINYHKNNFPKLLQTAKENIIIAQLKYEYADKITKIMENVLFYPIKGEYFNNDFRNDYILDFENIQGNSCNFVISNDNKSIVLKTTLNATKNQTKYIKELLEKNQIKLNV
ncbi:MAG: hypothetical protein U0457_01405 [Candidatus Sericytochromatia bacterium]